MYTVDKYGKALAASRKKGLVKENYWMYINDATREIKFSNAEVPEKGFTGYFIEDDTRVESTVQLAERRKRR